MISELAKWANFKTKNKTIYIYKLKHMAFFKDIKCINEIVSHTFIIHKLNVISEALCSMSCTTQYLLISFNHCHAFIFILIQ